MRYTLTIDGDFYEGMETLKEMVHLKELILAISEARTIIRSTLKHGDPNKDPEKVLEQIREVLTVPGIDY